MPDKQNTGCRQNSFQITFFNFQLKYTREDTKKQDSSSDLSTDQEESGYLSGDQEDDATESERDSEDVPSADDNDIAAEHEQSIDDDEHLCLINNNISAIKRPKGDIKDLFNAEDSALDQHDDDCRGSNSSMICQV